MGPGARGRYKRFLGFWFASPLSEMDGEGLFVPKMHAVLHMLAFLILWGANDNARLGDQGKDHQPYVKKAVRRTRQWETTFEDEVLGVADRIDAMLQIRSEERDSLFSRARRTQAPQTTAKPVCNQKLLLLNGLSVLEQLISVSEQVSCFTRSRALAALGRRPCARPHRGLLRPRRLS